MGTSSMRRLTTVVLLINIVSKRAMRLLCC